MKCSLLGQRTQQQLDVAYAWLAAQLSAGPQKAGDMKIAATMAGISNMTLRRANKSLGIVSMQDSEGWHWSLPKHPGQEKEEAHAQTGKSERLGQMLNHTDQRR